MNKLNIYREMIRAYLNGEIGEFVLNPDEDHATIVIEEMVRSARKSFCAYAQKMNPRVWTPAVLDELRRAVVDRQVDVRLLVEEDCEALSAPEFVGCESLRKSVRKNDGAISGLVRVNHFAVADGKAIRWETDSRTRSAEFSANDRVRASGAEKIFERLYVEGRRCA